MKHSHASMECSDIKACVIIMLSGGEKKFTSIRVKCATLKVALMAAVLSLNTLLINIYTP